MGLTPDGHPGPTLAARGRGARPIRAVDESNFPKIAYELRKRLETQTALIDDNVKAILVTGVEKAPYVGIEPGA
jgi:hypothetical protein